MILLLLLVPRACQALIGSEDAGPRADREQSTAGKADTGDNSSDDEAVGAKSAAGSEEAREEGEPQADGAAKDLGEILIQNLAVVVTEPAEAGAAEDLGSGDSSVGRTTPSPADVGDQWQVDRLASIDQQQAPATRRASAERQPSEGLFAPALRPGTGPSNTAAPVKKPSPGPKAEPDSDRAIAKVASVPEPVLTPAPGPVAESVAVPMVEPDPVSVPPRPVAVAPIRRAPLPVVRGILGRRGDTSIAANTGKVATSFGRGVVGARRNYAAAFPRAGAIRRAPAAVSRSVF